MAALGSGASFGFFMGIGMVIRTEMEESKPDSDECFLQVIDAEGTLRTEHLYERYTKF